MMITDHENLQRLLTIKSRIVADIPQMYKIAEFIYMIYDKFYIYNETFKDINHVLNALEKDVLTVLPDLSFASFSLLFSNSDHRSSSRVFCNDLNQDDNNQNRILQLSLNVTIIASNENKFKSINVIS